ncbi:hypothetical protein EOA75_19715 [Mesorhizobium sp. M1A.F.Ca.IN.022.07.1.1]|uniref:hypothetical protein n=1 Tax=unclassified Mesorhizobium TaxID=325217 RepID=UPI000FCBFF56|nr:MULTISPECIES: hypothetical protein [unclassified Mesorhizobium]RUV91416.1 hypothetical protein EOA75_19715 [Mesorhizobium sp. M1A.F.Ca.IN.022.07.1.1]RWM65086.1 MAG: hypothetical protein EOR82_31440 [Mesorhizobium sp.]RWM89343.1 MAG: hypothetical protein EOR86_29810 [Mesorhizobium sp.]TIS71489.1 MAG: hypothetical protein E5X11_00945 [Mesorhizobium sp.]TJV54534.1 MAG: hypothetical protein E5X82_31385 [Mesorhizobium sp.]
MELDSGHKAFWEVAHKNHPEQLKPGGALDFAAVLAGAVNSNGPDRFAKPSARGWNSSFHAKLFPNYSTKLGALAQTYKGLLNVKNPF